MKQIPYAAPFGDNPWREFIRDDFRQPEGQHAPYFAAAIGPESEEIAEALEKLRISSEKEIQVGLEQLDAAKYLGLTIQYIELRQPRTSYTTRRLKLDFEIREIDNPAVALDYFDHVRQLDQILFDLTKEIRDINDPSRLTPAIKTARAYIDAFRAFLDVAGGVPPASLPTELKTGMIHRVSSVSWMDVSERAVRLAEAAARFIKLFGW